MTPRRLRLWIPLLLVELLLLPFALLLLPFFCIACLVGRVNLVSALRTIWMLFSGLKGTHIEVDEPYQSVLIRIT